MVETLLLVQKSCIWDIMFRMYEVSKSIPAAKSQNFVNISRAQKPIWAKILEFEFFCVKRQSYIDIARTEINLVDIILTMKLLTKLYLLAQNVGQKWNFTFFGKPYITFASSFQASECFKEWYMLTKNQNLIYFGKSIMLA